MVSVASFSSLDHAITIARDIWFNKLDLSCWIEALFSRDCLNKYLTDATESTIQTLPDSSIAFILEKEQRLLWMDDIIKIANVSHRTFDLNKEPMFEYDMSERLKRDHEKFLALYISSGKTDTPDDKW
ncbi:hypothetical protein PIB30_057207 [Stylosanthes scabra]|uniref:Uncharacterized protein n=1 Tax=Stylosanthes scabra TaxID=79078 RepID=A0ABU6WHV8_9FABA|nr:hypothetical protein [Stylosanthes scabra]